MRCLTRLFTQETKMPGPKIRKVHVEKVEGSWSWEELVE